MRYFKYKNTNENKNNALKEQYETLTDDEKRIFRKEKRWRRISTITFFSVFIIFVASGILLLKLIPQPNSVLLKCLVVFGKVIAGFILLVVGGALSFGMTSPLWKKVESFHIPSMKKEIFSKACKHLRDYYQLQEPHIITKCFESTDERFRNHDVCIFVVGDELRITTDLVRGFLHGERDLGCYVFRRDEITISKQQDGNHLVAELRVDDTVFLLGYRAKGFIDKNFIAKSVK